MRKLAVSFLLIATVVMTGCAAKTSVTRTTTRTTATAGSADQQSTFFSPDGLAIDKQGNIYAVSGDRRLVEAFDPSGKIIAKWGSEGKGNGQFDRPTSIAVGPNGDVYVADSFGERVQKFGPKGKYITQWKPRVDFFPQPKGITTDSQGNVYVIEGRTKTVQKFNPTGKLISKFGSEGTGKGQFMFPSAIVTDPSGNIYVGETGGSFSNTVNGKTTEGETKPRIQKFSPSGQVISVISPDVSSVSTIDSIAVDGKGEIYIVGMSEIVKLNPAGDVVAKWGSMGSGPGQLSLAKSIVLDKQGNMYVGDSEAGRIQKFGPAGKYITEWHMK